MQSVNTKCLSKVETKERCGDCRIKVLDKDFLSTLTLHSVIGLSISLMDGLKDYDREIEYINYGLDIDNSMVSCRKTTISCLQFAVGESEDSTTIASVRRLFTEWRKKSDISNSEVSLYQDLLDILDLCFTEHILNFSLNCLLGLAYDSSED